MFSSQSRFYFWIRSFLCVNDIIISSFQAVGLLRLVAEIQGKQLTKVIESHKQILVDMIHPRKYYLRHQSVNAQVGVMEGTAFCTSLNPRLFSIG